MTLNLQEIDKIEVLTLVDNYIDILAADSDDVIQRPALAQDAVINRSYLAEHGFSALVTATKNGRSRRLLLDFGFSEPAVAFNADALGADLATIETLVLSHGHPDHTGGMKQVLEKLGRPGIELVLHPGAFRSNRYVKPAEEIKIHFPPFNRESLRKLGISVVDTAEPYPLLDALLLFLGEIPRETDFEQPVPFFRFEEAGVEKTDLIEDDTGIVGHIKGKGLVVISGCAHSGIINTVKQAQAVTGVNDVFAVMGGFHLSGGLFESRIEPTIHALKALNPRYVVPTHCTGRTAVMAMEKAMPDRFILNMSGTKLTFAA